MDCERSGKIRTTEVPGIDKIDSGRTIENPSGTIRKFAGRDDIGNIIHGISDEIRYIGLSKNTELKIAIITRSRARVNGEIIFDYIPFAESERQCFSVQTRPNDMVGEI